MAPNALIYIAAAFFFSTRLSTGASVSVFAGVTQYQGTPVSTNPSGVPALIYPLADEEGEAFRQTASRRVKDFTMEPKSLHPRQITSRMTVAPGAELRILPLGDSITYGYLSSDGNGYRIGLQEDLSGSNLHFLGSVQSGNMTDNFNEGHPGATINQIASFAKASLPERPNIILLHAGTKDMNKDPPADPYDSAPDRLGSLIDEIIAACPNAAILVAQVISAANTATEARIQNFNNQIAGVVARRANAGNHVMVVDMKSVMPADLQDGLHPSDEGYKKMADLWFAAIQAADAKGWIKPPVTPDQPRAGGESSSALILRSGTPRRAAVSLLVVLAMTAVGNVTPFCCLEENLLRGQV